MVVAFEGMPGAGKTSSLVSLAVNCGSSCLALSELNVIDETGNSEAATDWRIYHDMWLERQSLIEEIRNQFPLILVDRSHFSNIAVEQAKEAVGYAGQHTEVDRASQILKTSMYDAIIVCDTAPGIGLARRAGAHEVPELWSSLPFLTELRAFFKRDLPHRYPGPLYELDGSGLTRSEMTAAILRILRSLGLRRTQRAQPVTPEEACILEEAGSSRRLGPAYEQALRVLGYPTLYFRQHSLQLDGTKVRWFNTARVRELARQARA
jgi:thymidylate kinase